MEEFVQPFVSSDEYQLPKAAINWKIVEFRNGLTEGRQKEFNLLLDMMNNAHAEFVSKAYVYGTVNGIALREQVLAP